MRSCGNFFCPNLIHSWPLLIRAPMEPRTAESSRPGLRGGLHQMVRRSMRALLEKRIPDLEVGTRLGLAVSAVTWVPCALLIALSRFAPWPPHWLEAVVLFGLPAACIPVFALQASSRWRNHWWAGTGCPGGVLVPSVTVHDCKWPVDSRVSQRAALRLRLNYWPTVTSPGLLIVAPGPTSLTPCVAKVTGL